MQSSATTILFGIIMSIAFISLQRSARSPALFVDMFAASPVLAATQTMES